ncbi:GPN-loop GTPase 3 isoform X1 [Hydra vulgaris]|nr:GPN-loop GTPase 3 [Hydra vulgaris]
MQNEMRYAQLIMGPAGSGKSTYCKYMHEHCETLRREVNVINLDPAAENFSYPLYADVRELVDVNDVMEAEDLKLGPNGGLVFCMEYLMQNLDWLNEQLGEGEDDYFIFDCPGQIELYTHIPIMRQLVQSLQQHDFRICGVFIVDAQFLVDASKFFSGVMAALSAMIQLEIPHINVMSKMDLLDKESINIVENYLNPDAGLLLHDLNSALPIKFKKLNKAIASLIDDYSLVSFVPMNIKEEDSINDILAYIDNAIQYGEDLEPRMPQDEEDADSGFGV